MAKDFKTKEIRGTQTVADRLKTARKKHKLSLEDAERDTKIRLRYLQAFEESRYSKLPSEVHALGFLRRYGEYLNLDNDEIGDLYKIEWQAYKSKGESESGNDFSPNKVRGQSNFVITPKTIAIITVILLILGLFGYVWWAVKKFSAPPKLTITQPTNETTITGDVVTVKGQTDIGAYVLINNVPVKVGADGSFVQDVNIGASVDIIEIVVKNRLNSKTVHTIKIVNESNNNSP